ncbi:hypothetical protein ACIP9H_40310 [Streptomyces sp. NPDC088732]|uniref:hypothetical protein n=1 Tax=Streptomyces sp. NPDC088732 TaxID=3365879 RepID=UPI00382989C5
MADKDKRTYITVHDGMPDHPKVVAAGGMAAWLYVCGLAYCSRQLTDGRIPRAMVTRLVDLPEPEALASALLRVGLWHASGHDCDRCEPVEPDEYRVHDYDLHQKTADEVAELKEKRAAAGRKGGVRSGATRRAASKTPRTEANSEANAEALASGLVKQTRSKTEPPTPTPLSPTERELASQQDVPRIGERPDIPAASLPLIEKLTASGIVVGWELAPAEWFLIEALIGKCGIDVLVEHATAAFQAAPRRPRSGRYFLPGWKSLPDVPAGGGSAPLRAVSGGYQPYSNPTDATAYGNGW